MEGASSSKGRAFEGHSSLAGSGILLLNWHMNCFRHAVLPQTKAIPSLPPAVTPWNPSDATGQKKSIPAISCFSSVCRSQFLEPWEGAWPADIFTEGFYLCERVCSYLLKPTVCDLHYSSSRKQVSWRVCSKWSSLPTRDVTSACLVPRPSKTADGLKNPQ